MEENKVSILEIIGKIMTDKVEISEEEYKEMLKAVAKNYDDKNGTKTKMPSLSERRKRIQTNFYGQIVNMLFQILTMQNCLTEEFNKQSLLIEAIAEKNGIEFEKIETEEEKALKAVQDYFIAGAKKRLAEKEEIEKNGAKDNIVPFKK